MTGAFRVKSGGFLMMGWVLFRGLVGFCSEIGLILRIRLDFLWNVCYNERIGVFFMLNLKWQETSLVV